MTPDISHVLLLVTWFVAGQSPASYQVEFTDYLKCDHAKDQLYRYRNMVADDFKASPFIRSPGAVTAKAFPPDLLAFCVPK